MDQDLAGLLTELIEKVGLLRRDMQHRKEFDQYEARFVRIERAGFSGLGRLCAEVARFPRKPQQRTYTSTRRAARELHRDRNRSLQTGESGCQ